MSPRVSALANRRPDARPPLRAGAEPAPRLRGWLAYLLGIVTIAVVWWFLAAWVNRPYVLPTPSAVLAELVAQHGRITWHAEATLAAVLLGFSLGFVVATVLGYAIARSPTLEQLVAPYLVTSQALPVVAIAPILVYWLGSGGLTVKVVTAALIVFFPILINTVVGLRAIDPAYRDLMHVLSASRSQSFRWVELPTALPVLLAGVRIGVTLAVIGAVVGEFLGADRGLGALIQIAGSQFNDALMFAALLTLAAMALVLYGSASLAEHTLLRNRGDVSTADGA
jgi:NitT/TauT family transport system permease protein